MAYNPDIMEGQIFNLINSIIDFFFILDIFVSFRTTFVDNRGEEVYDSWHIALKYMKLMFWIDLSAVIPFDKFAPQNEIMHQQELLVGTPFNELPPNTLEHSQQSNFLLFGALKFGRLTKLAKIIMYLRVDGEVKQYFNLILLIFFIIVYIHCFACVWWFSVNNE